MREYHIRRDLSFEKLVQLKGCGVEESHCEAEICCSLIEKSSLVSSSSKDVSGILDAGIERCSGL